MIYRAALFAYFWVTLSIAWLGWAIVQTVARGTARLPEYSESDPAHDGYSISNCYSWALWKLITEGGTLHICQSPRIPLWRAEWSPEGSTERWHFEPRHPKRGISGIWHSFLHEGRPRRSGSDV